MEAEEVAGPAKDCFRAVPVRSDVHRLLCLGLGLYCLDCYSYTKAYLAILAKKK